MNIMWSLFSHFKQRALLWSLEQFISEGVDVKGYMRSALFAVAAAAACGVLISFTIAAGLGAVYYYLITDQGYDIPTALIIVGLSALVPALILGWFAKSVLGDLKNFSTPAPLKAPVGVDRLTGATSSVVNSFVEGFLKPKPRAQIMRSTRVSDVKPYSSSSYQTPSSSFQTPLARNNIRASR